MSRIKSRDTNPEKKVRSVLHRMGYRFRLHSKKLPGHPDIILPKFRKVIFVHGCFWHGHNCPRGKRPETNKAFWNNKIEKNIIRDLETQKKLIEIGWTPLVLWQCETKDLDKLTMRLVDFLKTNNG